MDNYKNFQLTEADIRRGTNNFLRQLVIEAGYANALEDLSSSEPKISYLVGQPGSGKTTLGNSVKNEYKENGEWAAEIGSDKIATFHLYYDELLKLLPEDCYTLSREFVRPAQKAQYYRK